MKYSLILPQVWTKGQVRIKDPIQAYQTMTHVTQLADESGYEAVWLIDHFYTVPRPTQEFSFECWTSIAALACDTRRVRIGSMVSCNSYRNPALVAILASTVDVLSHGRLNFGIGAGWYEQEYHAYGYDYPNAPERLRALGEAVQVILNMWTQEETVFEGTYYQLRSAINRPKGMQKPHIPFLIGGSGEQVTLKLVAQYGDACNVSGDLATIRHKFAVIKKHCENVRRDYESIHRTASLLYIIGETDKQAQSKLPQKATGSFAEYLKNALVVSPDTIRKSLAAYEIAGVQEAIITFLDITKLDSIKLFAEVENCNERVLYNYQEMARRQDAVKIVFPVEHFKLLEYYNKIKNQDQLFLDELSKHGLLDSKNPEPEEKKIPWTSIVNLRTTMPTLISFRKNTQSFHLKS